MVKMNLIPNQVKQVNLWQEEEEAVVSTICQVRGLMKQIRFKDGKIILVKSLKLKVENLEQIKIFQY